MAKAKTIEELKNPGLTGYIFKPMWITLKHVFKKNQPEDWWNRRPCTLLYPHEKDDMGDAFRGLLSVSDELCIECGLCVRECPNDCLEMVELDTEKGTKQRPQAYLGRCMFCGFCEEFCPTGAFVLIQDYELGDTEKTGFILTPEMLNSYYPEDVSAHRKELPDTYPALEIDKCISCQLCAKKCPQDAIEMVDIPGSAKAKADGTMGKPKKLPIFDYSKCVWCQVCEDSCKPMALNFIHKNDAERVNKEHLESLGGRPAVVEGDDAND